MNIDRDDNINENSEMSESLISSSRRQTIVK